jgi:hypothetical protein
MVFIFSAKTHPKTDKPYDDINMVSISVREYLTFSEQLFRERKMGGERERGRGRKRENKKE